jgi:hypothetical protein
MLSALSLASAGSARAARLLASTPFICVAAWGKAIFTAAHENSRVSHADEEEETHLAALEQRRGWRDSAPSEVDPRRLRLEEGRGAAGAAEQGGSDESRRRLRAEAEVARRRGARMLA